MHTVHDYMIIPANRKSIVQLLAEKTHQRETEIIGQAAEELNCPNERFVWVARYVECRELPARLILWGIDQLFPQGNVENHG